MRVGCGGNVSNCSLKITNYNNCSLQEPMSNGFNLFNNASKAASPSRLFKENESRVGSSRISNPSQAQVYF